MAYIPFRLVIKGLCEGKKFVNVWQWPAQGRISERYGCAKRPRDHRAKALFYMRVKSGSPLLLFWVLGGNIVVWS